jgi:hypothetical protein
MRPIDLPAKNAFLMAQEEQFRLRVLEAQPPVGDVQQEAKA